MVEFVVGTIVTFVTLTIAAFLVRFPKDYGKFFMAAATYGILLAIPIPIPLVGMFVPPIGMYMVLVGSNYQTHDWVMKLCIVNFIVNLVILVLVSTMMVTS